MFDTTGNLDEAALAARAAAQAAAAATAQASKEGEGEGADTSGDGAQVTSKQDGTEETDNSAANQGESNNDQELVNGEEAAMKNGDENETESEGDVVLSVKNDDDELVVISDQVPYESRNHSRNSETKLQANHHSSKTVNGRLSYDDNEDVVVEPTNDEDQMAVAATEVRAMSRNSTSRPASSHSSNGKKPPNEIDE